MTAATAGRCANPDHARVPQDACSGCQAAAEAELTALRDRWMQTLHERGRWERDVTAAAQDRARRDAETVIRLHVQSAAERLLAPVREVAGRASMITPDMVLSGYRERVERFQEAARRNLAAFDAETAEVTAEAAALRDAQSAENRLLRALLADTGRRLHRGQDRRGETGPCRCDGCELVRAAQLVRVTPAAGVPS